MEKIISIKNFEKEINNGHLKAKDLVNYLLTLNNITTNKESSIALKDLIIDNRNVVSATIDTSKYNLILTLSNNEITGSESKKDITKFESKVQKFAGRTTEEKVNTIINYIDDQMQKTDILELEINRKINKQQYNKIIDQVFKKINEKYCSIILAKSFNILVYQDRQTVKNYVREHFTSANIKKPNVLKNKFKQYQQKALDLYHVI